jgi:hypothetical protein
MVTYDDLKNASSSSLPLNVKVEAFFKGTIAISNFSEKIIIPQLDALQTLSNLSSKKLSNKDTAIIGTYYRMYLWVRSLTVMNSRQHFQATASATRSLVELLFDLKLIQSDTSGEYLKKYFEFVEVSKYLSAKKLVSFCDQHLDRTKLNSSHQRAFLNNGARQTKVENKVRTIWGINKKNGDPNFPSHWSGMHARLRAQRLDTVFKTIQYEELYIESYPLGSLYVHDNPAGHIFLNEDTFESTFGVCHNITQRVFLEATILCAEEMKISLAIPRFNQIIEELRNATSYCLVEKQIEFLNSEATKGISSK